MQQRDRQIPYVLAFSMVFQVVSEEWLVKA